MPLFCLGYFFFKVYFTIFQADFCYCTWANKLRLLTFVTVNEDWRLGMAKNLTKEDKIVQFTDEDCKMAVGLANRRTRPLCDPSIECFFRR